MSNSRATDESFVGSFQSLAELNTRYPAVTSSGAQASVFSVDREAPYICDGNVWQPLLVYGVTVAGNRTLTQDDLGQVLDVSATATLTVPNDATLGITSAKDRRTVAAYQMTAGAVTWGPGAGVTLRGTAPTAAQYTTVGIMRVGANEWAYL